MKIFYYSHYFLNNTKPNRLIFKEQPTEGQNSPPAQKELRDLNEQVKEGNPLALERVLVMESFRKRVLDMGALDTSFEGDDFTKIEKAKNPVFQYLYEKLDGFFKNQTSTEWPVNRQREWMNTVADYFVDFIKNSRFDSNIFSKEGIDKNIPLYITEGHENSGRITTWVPTSIGSFPVWFSKRYPREYQKFFGKAD